MIAALVGRGHGPSPQSAFTPRSREVAFTWTRIRIRERLPIKRDCPLSFPRKRETRATARRVPLDHRFRGDDQSDLSETAVNRAVRPEPTARKFF